MCLVHFRSCELSKDYGFKKCFGVFISVWKEKVISQCQFCLFSLFRSTCVFSEEKPVKMVTRKRIKPGLLVRSKSFPTYSVFVELV